MKKKKTGDASRNERHIDYLEEDNNTNGDMTDGKHSIYERIKANVQENHSGII